MARLPAKRQFEHIDDVAAALDRFERRVLGRDDLRALWSDYRDSLSMEEFISLLTENLPLRPVRLPFPARPIQRYIWKEASSYELVQSINSRGYFSHYTAIQLHGLTEQLPKTLYFNIEQERAPGGGQLTQAAIDRTFHGKTRVSSNVAIFEDREICLLNGANTQALGVELHRLRDGTTQVRVTNIERTLLDATVRPIYSGGVYEVRKAFETAKDRLSVNRLCSYLKRIGYTYPYHQLIGFYLERTGYRESQIELLRQFPIEFDFYLDYGLKDKAYDSTWRVFFPKGFE